MTKYESEYFEVAKDTQTLFFRLNVNVTGNNPL